MNPVLRQGVIWGAGYSLLGIAFILLSTLTTLERSVWLVLNQLVFLVLLGCCGVAGFRAAQQTGQLATGTLAGLCVGAIGITIYSLALWLIPLTFAELVRQYPFEYFDFLTSGASDVNAWLQSERGYRTFTSTSIGLLPVALPFTAGLGAGLGALGSLVNKSWNRMMA